MRLAVVMWVWGSLCLAPAMAADGDPARVFTEFQRELQTIFEKCRSAVVRIEATDQRGYLSGTGFFIDPNGTIYTSYTVGGESRDIQVAFGGHRFAAQRLVGDLRSGVAILQIHAETPFLTFGDSRQLTVAAPVIALGYPMDLPLRPVYGTVGGFDLKYQGRFFATTHIRANITAQRGEGGAPLLNARGEVVGLLISRVESGDGSFVLPIEAAEKVRKDFMRFHEVRPGWIGVRVKPLETPVDGSTAAIEETIADAPGEKAGLHTGDVILQVGTHRITCPEDALDASFFLTAEDVTMIRVARDGSEREFSIMPVDNPDSARSPLPTFGAAADTPSPALKLGR